MRKFIISMMFLSLLLLTACDSGTKAVSDLSGTWVESDAASEKTYQQATIGDGVIEIVWVNVDEKSTMLYWAGTYIAPETPMSEYSWNSINDTTRTHLSLFASEDDMKKFTYKDGKLSYSVSAMGVTKTVSLEIKE